MWWAVFLQAGRSPHRQRIFHALVGTETLIVAVLALVYHQRSESFLFSTLGNAMLLMGIVNGAILLGWRLTQLPKSKALETLFLADASSASLLGGEIAAGLAQIVFASITPLPILVVLAGFGRMDSVSLLVFPFQTSLWAAVVGLGLTWWAYERRSIRKVGERFMGLLLTVYLIVGGLVGEHTFRWLRSDPTEFGSWVADGLLAVHFNHPFSLFHRLGQKEEVWDNLSLVTLFGMFISASFAIRALQRLKPHYAERHDRPLPECASGSRGNIGDAPLTWWAVRRVREYAGSVNLYLAGGTACLYSAFMLLGPYWPDWLGQRLFLIFEQHGGVSTITTMLVLLAAVPAAYQYGLWDSSKLDRCRRWEVLLTTDLHGEDFERAAWASSWSRGRGYFYAAMLVWLSAAWSGRVSWLHVFFAFAASLALIVLYFSLGFRALVRTGEGTRTGFLLAVVIPLAAWLLGSMDAQSWIQILPPVAVFDASRAETASAWTGLCIVEFLLAAVVLLRLTHRDFDSQIRLSFEKDLLSL